MLDDSEQHECCWTRAMRNLMLIQASRTFRSQESWQTWKSSKQLNDPTMNSFLPKQRKTSIILHPKANLTFPTNSPLKGISIRAESKTKQKGFNNDFSIHFCPKLWRENARISFSNKEFSPSFLLVARLGGWEEWRKAAREPRSERTSKVVVIHTHFR
jgi:hypothetical protein